MEPQQARLTFAVFLAFSAAILFNALFLQRDAGFAIRESIDSVPAPFHAGFGLAAQSTERRDLLRAVRRELSQRNYFPGHSSTRLDGRMDAMTMGAIMAFQHDSGLDITGLATDGLLKSFLFGIDKAARPRDENPPLSRDTRQLVAEIQGILSAKGYYSGKIDGVFASNTRQAVRRFEGHRGLPVTGRISGLLVQEFIRMTGVEFSASQK